MSTGDRSPRVEDYEGYLKNLPVMPQAATRIMSIAEDKLELSFKELENIIKIDPGLTAAILKIANSALYARPRQITNLQRALTLLGFKNIRSLVMLVTASKVFSRHKRTDFYRGFWRHSLVTAFLARHIARRCNRQDAMEEVFLGGLLHPIGQAALYNADADRYARLLECHTAGETNLETLEEEEFGLNHRLLGTAILKKWNFPNFYVDVIMELDSVNTTSPHKALIMIISVADLLTEQMGFGFSPAGGEELLRQCLLYTCLEPRDLEYYYRGFIEEAKKDPLFQECQSLFSI